MQIHAFSKLIFKHMQIHAYFLYEVISDQQYSFEY